MRKILFVILFMILTIPLFSQSITIDKSKLDLLIKTEIQKAVTEAVAIAVKEEDTKYILIISDKDQLIASLNGTIAKRDIQIKELNIQMENAVIDLNNYKNLHSFTMELFIDSTCFIGGAILGGITGMNLK